MNEPKETAKGHMMDAKDDIEDAAMMVTDSIKSNASEKIEHGKDKTKDAINSASSALINGVNKIHNTDNSSKR